MRIISFAHTIQAILEDRKVVTRRDWIDKYALTFRQGDIVQAYNKSPRAGGHRIALIKITRDPYKQWLHDMTDEDEKLEGGLWGSADRFREFMGPDREVWVIEFQIINERRLRYIEIDPKALLQLFIVGTKLSSISVIEGLPEDIVYRNALCLNDKFRIIVEHPSFNTLKPGQSIPEHKLLLNRSEQ